MSLGKVAVVGAGLIGQGWSILMAKAGYEVRVFDNVTEESVRCVRLAREALDDLQRWGATADAKSACDLISVSGSLSEAVEGANYVQECVSEKAEVKSEVFVQLDALSPPDTILASSCSAIPPDEFLSRPRYRQRCLVAHPFSPPHLIPLVELVGSSWTDRATMETTQRFLKTLGQYPVVVHKPVIGYVVNRLQAAVIAESLSLVQEGVITPEDLDACMKHGLGRRWAFIGPFETMDLNSVRGFADYVAKFYDTGYRHICSDLNVGQPWGKDAIAAVERWRRKEATDEHALAELRKRRDRTLAKLGMLLAANGSE